MFSEVEVAHYSSIFKESACKFVYIPLGIGRIKGTHPIGREGFILSVGRSNRDYKFLIESIADTDYQLIILSDTISSDISCSNIEIHNDIFIPKMFDYLNACKLVVIPLDNPKISAGQLFFLQAMQLGKPIIITESDSVSSYIKDGHNGLVIKKDKKMLLDAINRLYTDEHLYNELAANGQEDFNKFHSTDSMAKHIIQEIRKA